MRGHDSGRWLPLGLGLAGSLPILVSIGHAIAVGWAPIGDDGIIAIHAFDVFSGHSPLLGMPSSGPTGVLDEQVYHPGPLLFWLLSIPAHFIGAVSLPITMGLVNCACVVGCVVLAARRGALPLAVATAVAIPLMLTSIPAEAYTDIWNPAAALLPLTLLMFVAWSVACGDDRLLPVAILLASFAAQCHLIFAFTALAALLVGLGGLALARRLAVRSLVAALAVGLVCWSAPLIDQVTNSPGNLVLLSRAARASTEHLGFGTGRRALIRAVGIRPWWLQAPRGPLERIGDLGRHPNPLAIGSSLVVLAGLAAAGLFGWRRGRADVVAAAVLALALCAALVLTTRSIPRDSFGSVGYALWLASPVGMFAWIALFWSVAVLLPARTWSGVQRVPAATGAAAGLAVAAVVSAIVAVDADPKPEPFDQVREVTSSVDDAVHTESVRVDASFGEDGFFVGRGFQFATIYSLLRAGRSVTAPPIEVLIGKHYAAGRADTVVDIHAARGRQQQGPTVATVVVPPARSDNPFSKPHDVTVTASIKPAS